MIFGAAVWPARMSEKADAPSESGRCSVQSKAPKRPSKMAAAVSRKSWAVYVYVPMKVISCKVMRRTSKPPVPSPKPMCPITPPGRVCADAVARVAA